MHLMPAHLRIAYDKYIRGVHCTTRTEREREVEVRAKIWSCSSMFATDPKAKSHEQEDMPEVGTVELLDRFPFGKEIMYLGGDTEALVTLWTANDNVYKKKMVHIEEMEASVDLYTKTARYWPMSLFLYCVDHEVWDMPERWEEEARTW